MKHTITGTFLNLSKQLVVTYRYQSTTPSLSYIYDRCFSMASLANHRDRHAKDVSSTTNANMATYRCQCNLTQFLFFNEKIHYGLSIFEKNDRLQKIKH